MNVYLIRQSGSFVCMSYLDRITITLPIRRAINVPVIQAEIVNSIAFIGPTFSVNLWDPVINPASVVKRGNKRPNDENQSVFREIMNELKKSPRNSGTRLQHYS